MTDATFHLPQEGGLGDPYWDFVRVVDADTGEKLEKVEHYHVAEGWVDFQAWNARGEYEPRRESRTLRVELNPNAPADVKAWFSIPTGDARRGLGL